MQWALWATAQPHKGPQSGDITHTEIALCHQVMKLWEMTMTLQATKANQGEHLWDGEAVAKKLSQ